MSVEEEFDIQIPDTDGGEFRTIPQVVEKVDKLTSDSVFKKDIEERVLNILYKEFGLSDLKGDENLFEILDD